MADEKALSREILGKTIVSKSGKKFGTVGDLIFESRTGELIFVALKQPSSYALALNLEKDKAGSLVVPFSAVISVGDFLIVSEEDIV